MNILTRDSVLARTIIICLALVFALNGCVKTMDKEPPKVDKKKALEANIKLGMTYLQQNQREGAVRSFNKALEIDKRSAEAYFGLALLHQMNGEFPQADASFKKALRSRVDISKSGIEFSYGRFLYDQKRYKDALKQFESASADYSYPRRAVALMNVGRVSLQLGDKVRAKSAFEHSLNLNPRLAQSALELAELAFNERDYTNAKRYLDQFNTSSRAVPRSLWLGIRIERIFGNKDKEASYVLALKNLFPYSKEYLDYKRFIEQN